MKVTSSPSIRKVTKESQKTRGITFIAKAA